MKKTITVLAFLLLLLLPVYAAEQSGNGEADIIISPYRGKTMTVIGDSIAHGSYAGSPWYTIIKERYGLSSVVDLAKDGATFSIDGSIGNKRLTEVVKEIEGIPDIIAVFCGTNDFARNVAPGELSDDPSDENGATFCASVKYTLEYLLQKYPDSKIVYMTPLKRNDRKTYDYKNKLGYHLYQYADMIRELADTYGVFTADLYNDSGFDVFDPDFKREYTQNVTVPDGDGLHPNKAGTALYTKNCIIPVFDEMLDKIDPALLIILTIGNKEATVFNEEKTNDVAPVIKNNRTMLPIRFIAEALGATVDWNADEKKVTIKNSDTEIIIYINSDKASVNGEETALDSPAFIESNRTYLPLRFVTENLGASVFWDKDTQQVIITKNI